MVHNVATHWNSTAELMECALLLHKALNLLVNFEQHNRPRSSHLKWELLEKLFPMLEVVILCLNITIYTVLTLLVSGLSHCYKANVAKQDTSSARHNSSA